MVTGGEDRLYTYAPAFGMGDAFFVYYDEKLEKYFLEFLPEHDMIPVYEAKICPPESGFICINSDIFFFSFPKILDPEMKKWIFEESTFEIVESFSISFEGEESVFFTVDRYENSGDRNRERFLYNPSLGLLSFGYIRYYKDHDREPDFRGVIYYTLGKGFGAKP